MRWRRTPCKKNAVAFLVLFDRFECVCRFVLDAADTLRIWARGRPVDGGAERALLPRGELRVGLLGESAMHLPVEVEIERAFFYGDTTKALGGGGGGV